MSTVIGHDDANVWVLDQVRPLLYADHEIANWGFDGRVVKKAGKFVTNRWSEEKRNDYEKKLKKYQRFSRFNFALRLVNKRVRKPSAFSLYIHDVYTLEPSVGIKTA